MSDPYAWFDPHEEREARERGEGQLRWARQQIDHARTEGREEILRLIVDREQSYFWSVAKDAIGYLATRTAEEIVFPRMRASYDEAKNHQRIMAREFQALSMQILTPMMMAKAPLGLTALMSPPHREEPPAARFVYQMPAFSFTQEIPPLRDFR